MKYSIGIDLGTTHCTMAAAPLEGGALEQIPLEQWIGAGLRGESSLLPSLLYFPPSEEQERWGGAFCMGRYVAERGAEQPDRVASSAKSWLCRAEAESRTLVEMSPVEVIAELLRELRRQWDERHPEAPFGDQAIVVTVPASFDPAARERVSRAAESIGYPEMTLMEEPQAAFYAWLERQGERWREQLAVGDLILVVDIGGGTTDLSLIEVVEEGGELELERIAVGDHLLLGGDNMDLALAHLAASRIGGLDEWQMKQLVHQARFGKERLLGADAPDELTLSIAGRGSGLIGGSLKTTVGREEAERLLVDGFFPMVGRGERPIEGGRSGLRQSGLHYAADPRITAHLAKFLDRLPTKLLFNGGTMKAAALQKRVVAQLRQWGADVELLPDSDLDCAVGRGAAHYGVMRAAGGVRIRGGTSHSYWVGVEEAMPAIPGLTPPMRAICVAPLGMEEGSESTLEGERFSLVIGEPALFRFFRAHRCGDVGEALRHWEEELEELPPIEATLEGSEERVVEVAITAKITELGSLELWCCSEDGSRWKFEFAIREREGAHC